MKWLIRYLSITMPLLSAFLVVAAVAKDDKIEAYSLTLENHVFTPKEIFIPANQKVKIIIHNKDQVAEEFDSFDLNRERVIFAGKHATIFVGPLPPGRYEYFGEFHPNTARGFIVVKELSEK